MDNFLVDAPLGKTSAYETQYNPKLLFPIPRQLKRDEIGVPNPLPFHGVDAWNSFELSWLNTKGKPVVAIGEFYFPCISEYLIESKSFKLYLNSFNQTQFASAAEVQSVISKDLTLLVGCVVEVKITPVEDYQNYQIDKFTGSCLDNLDITTQTYEPYPDFLSLEPTRVAETVYSHLLKSNCLITGQPDWGSILIRYQGQKINHEGLLKYLISFRNHNEFHEQCVEKIFMDILNRCQPTHLTVYARYTRRGGLDINPFRSNFEEAPANIRLNRQ